jgi:hypothetical protein
MRMPDARDYMGPGGSYPYAQGGDGGYGVAPAGAGAGAAAYGAREYANEGGPPQSTSSQGHGSPVAAAKQREAQMETQRLRLSHQYAESGGSGGRAEELSGSPPLMDDRRTSGVYQHTDMGSVPDPEEEEERPAEVPPK